MCVPKAVVFIQPKSNTTLNGTAIFENNESFWGSSIMVANSKLEFHGMVMFANNTCSFNGCGITSAKSNITFNGTATFDFR